MLVLRVVGTAGTLHALAKILVALMPLAEGNPLRNDATGNPSLSAAILIFGRIVILNIMVGGLWAVLMTDVLQFISGLIVAAMSSATASMVSSQLNVLSGVLTNDLYQPLVGKKSDRHMMRVRRFFTVLIGVVLIGISLQIGNVGGVRDMIITVTS